MPVELNHTIVHARDPAASAAFLAEVLGLAPPFRFGPFHSVQLDNGVTLDYLPAGKEHVTERVRKLEAAGVITGYQAKVNLQALGYGIRAVMRVGRTEYARIVKLVRETPEVVNAYNVTGEDSWILEIAVIDVEHLDAVVTRFCLLADTSTAIILNAAREHQVMLPPRREDVKPPIRKVRNC